MKRVAHGVLEQTFEHLRRCGEGRRECVVFLTGPLEIPDLIDQAVHPSHRASAGGYELASAGIADISTQLLAARRTVRAQVHTHPGVAYHSPHDDEFALVHTPGFLSLVIPRFALGPVGLDGAFLAERDRDGGWVAVPPDERLELC
ncbi:MAG TPA: hypothetical protein VHT27_08990 [Solirubrobacteraceae bacterium]|jgi:hypothetical protein|nr:hypothetical protein [Solirubrobacteraceae bacterium]